MDELKNLQGNIDIVRAIHQYHEKNTKENLKAVVLAIMKRTHEDSSFLLPIQPPKGKEEGFGGFRMVETKDKKMMLPVFTERESAVTAPPTNCMTLPIRVALGQALQMDGVDGVIINAWSEPLIIEKEMVQKILESDHKMNLDRQGVYLYHGDLTRIGNVECIVNSADPLFNDGGGVDHAIYEVGGEGLLKALDGIGSCKLGEAKLTLGFGLPHRYVVHTVGPVWDPDEEGDHAADKKALASCYVSCLDRVTQQDIHTVAFPAISTGASGFPLKEAAAVAVPAVKDWISSHKDYGMSVILCCYDDEAFAAFRDVLAEAEKK